ncbi:MAG: hypothetical protein AB7H88_22210 [Vicinamibacterales bacterium]
MDATHPSAWTAVTTPENVPDCGVPSSVPVMVPERPVSAMRYPPVTS